MERDANVDKKKQMTLTFQMRKEGAFLMFCLFASRTLKHGISSLINIIALLMNIMHVKESSNDFFNSTYSNQKKIFYQ